jgi:hypothetical protein
LEVSKGGEVKVEFVFIKEWVMEREANWKCSFPFRRNEINEENGSLSGSGGGRRPEPIIPSGYKMDFNSLIRFFFIILSFPTEIRFFSLTLPTSHPS